MGPMDHGEQGNAGIMGGEARRVPPATDRPGIMEAGQPSGGGMLMQIAEAVEQKVPQQLRNEYEAIVVSGLGLMTGKETKGEFRKLIDRAGQVPEAERPKVYAHGVVKALTVIFNESGVNKNPERQQRFVDAAPLAGMTLMAHVLETAESMGQPVNAKILQETGKAVASGFFAAFKIDGEQVKQAMATGQQLPGSLNQQPASPPPAAAAPTGGMA